MRVRAKALNYGGWAAEEEQGAVKYMYIYKVVGKL